MYDTIPRHRAPPPHERGRYPTQRRKALLFVARSPSIGPRGERGGELQYEAEFFAKWESEREKSDLRTTSEHQMNGRGSQEKQGERAICGREHGESIAGWLLCLPFS